MNKIELPNGKLTIRHRQMRNVFQCFAGNTYLDGASGDDDSDAINSLVCQYNVPSNTCVTIYGYKEPIIKIINA